MRDYPESVTIGQTHRQTDGRTDRQSDPYVTLCFARDKTMSSTEVVFQLVQDRTSGKCEKSKTINKQIKKIKKIKKIKGKRYPFRKSPYERLHGKKKNPIAPWMFCMNVWFNFLIFVENTNIKVLLYMYKGFSFPLNFAWFLGFPPFDCDASKGCVDF